MTYKTKSFINQKYTKNKTFQVSKFSGEVFTCGHYLMKVGGFRWDSDHYNQSTNTSGLLNKELPEYTFNKSFDWPKGFKPLDEPACGYHEEKCQGGKGVTEIAAGILGGLLVFALILTLSVYRKWKIEQEIEGLLWKINPECLQNYPRLHPCPSKQSLGSLMSGKENIVFKTNNFNFDFFTIYTRV